MDFPPLFNAGFHEISLDDFEEIFVTSFQNKNRRRYLMNRFFAFIESFEEIGINAEIWIDGSFSTQKEEPNDIDILFIVDEMEVNQLAPESQNSLTNLFDRNESKIRYCCDLFLITSNNFDIRSYWRGWFGFSRNEAPKGIPRINYVANSQTSISY